MSILIDENTTFIIQGITGREAVNMTRECLDYGSKVVGGVTPGRGGRDVYGVPVYDTVREITSKESVDGSVLTVPPAFVCDAAFEALENGIRLLVIVTERVPRAEVAQIVEFADMKGARIIGPNCLGIISPGKSKMGGIGGPAANTNQAYRPGHIGVMSRSGGMPGMRFGHAGTIVEGKQDTASEKIRRLNDAGISVAEEIAQIQELVKQRLS